MRVPLRLLFIVAGSMAGAYALYSYLFFKTTLVSAVVLGLTLGFTIVAFDSARYYRQRTISLELVPQSQAKEVKPQMTTLFILKSKRLTDFANNAGKGIAEDLLVAGIPMSPLAFMAQHIFWALVSIPVIAVAISVLYPFVSFYAMLIAPVPLLIYGSYRLRLRAAKSARRKDEDDELAYFVLVAGILQMAGLSLYHSFHAIIGKRIFRHIEQDAQVLERNLMVFDKDPVSAIDHLGRLHPNPRMRALLLGYTTQLLSGGDLTEFLNIKMADMLRDLKFKWQSYLGTASNLGELMVGVFFIAPVFVIMSAFVNVGSINTVSQFVLIVLPVLTVVVYEVVATFQPKTYDSLMISVRAPVVVSAFMFVLSALVFPPWAAVSLAVGFFTGYVGLIAMIRLREIRSLENYLPQFVEDLTEFKKIGYSIENAIRNLAEHHPYDPVLNNMLDKYTQQMNLGTPLSKVDVKFRSWLGNMVVFFLGLLGDTGGGSPVALGMFSNFMREVVNTKKEVRNSMRLYEFLTYITPVGLAVALSMMSSMIGAISNVQFFGGSTLFSQLGQAGQALGVLTPILIILSSISMALIAGKAIDFTSYSTIRIAINVALGVIAILLVPVLTPLIVPSVG